MRTNDSPEDISFKRIFYKFLAVLFIGVLLFFLICILVIGVYQIWYADCIFPGIYIDNVGVGSLSQAQAENYLTANFHFTPSDKISLWYGDTKFEVYPEQIGIYLDSQTSVDEAFHFGRAGSIGSWFAYQLGGSFSPHTLPPTVIFDQTTAVAFLQQLAQQQDRPTIEAELVLQGTQVIAKMGQIGRQLNIQASLEQINLQINQLNLQQIILPVAETAPQILDASPYANLAQEILNRSISLTIPAGQPDAGTNWIIHPEELAPMLTFETRQEDGQTKLVPQLKQDVLDAYLEELAQQIEIKTENPRFIFNDETGELDLLTPGESGRRMDSTNTAAAIQEALAQGQTSIEIALVIQEPDVSDSATGAELGITELVHSESSYFYGSSKARVQNIKTAAGQFHGLLVAPGSTFSMAEAMDEITLDNGYTEALIIYNGQTIEGVGGGVCQVSTTLFRAAFFSGFQITERHPHAYRVSYYEKTAGNQRDNNLAGLDATVYVPIIDLKFINDTPDWLLMETYVDESASRITWKFYSTWDGRTVDWETSGPTNVEEPEKPLYNENPELDAGEIKQVEWEADGADVRVDRSVFNQDGLLFADTFNTHYEPWRSVYEYGPGTEGIPTEQDE